MVKRFYNLLTKRVKSGKFGHQVNSDTHLQSVEIQMRQLLVSRLIRIFTVCMVYLILFQSFKNKRCKVAVRIKTTVRIYPTLPYGFILELHETDGTKRMLHDEDASNEKAGIWKRLNTLQHYNIEGGSKVELTVSREKDLFDVCKSRNKTLKLLKTKYSKTCVKRPLLKDHKLVFNTNSRLIQVKSIAECSKGSILQYFRPY